MLLNSQEEKNYIEPQNFQCQRHEDVKLKIAVSLIEYLALIAIKKQHRLSCEEISEFVKQEFNIFLSPGTYCWALWIMEDKKLIRRNTVGYNIAYSLTVQGRASIDAYRKKSVEILDFVSSLLNHV